MEWNPSMPLTEDQCEQVHTLWDELADFPASQAEDALRHLQQKFSSWLNADDVTWVGGALMMQDSAALHDPQLGWRGLVTRHMRLTPLVAERTLQAMSEQDTEPALTTQALVAGAGSFRVHRLHDGFVDMAAFEKTPHYRVFYKEAGIVDRMFVCFPINADAESYFLFDRMRGGAEKQFSLADAQLVAYAMRGLKWFQRELMLHYGLLLARQPLTDTERRIVTLLLTDLSEKEIAAKLGQAPATTHKYITGILRKFGVRGRTGLMALWLGWRN
jgi:DNA-binding CsgD family transcriptional regulator